MAAFNPAGASSGAERSARLSFTGSTTVRSLAVFLENLDVIIWAI